MGNDKNLMDVLRKKLAERGYLEDRKNFIS